MANTNVGKPQALHVRLATHRDDILQIAREHGARRVRVFGSVARGDDRPESDLDILVDLEPGTTLWDLVAIKQDVEDLLHCSVDVVTERSVSPYIREVVLRDAVDLDTVWEITQREIPQFGAQIRDLVAEKA